MNYQPDGAVPVSNGSLAFYPAQTNVIPRPPQPYLNSRGSVRGSARGGRSLANSYRSPGGYKGMSVFTTALNKSNVVTLEHDITQHGIKLRFYM